MNTLDVIVMIIFGIPISIWAYQRIIFLGAPPYAKFENYLRRKNMTWLLMVEEFVIWVSTIVFICGVCYFILNL